MTLSAETQAQLQLMSDKLIGLQNQIDVIRAQQLPIMQDMALLIAGMEGDTNPVPKPRVLFCSPVTGAIETGANVFGLDWFDAVGYCKLYSSSSNTQAYHTGADLNRPAWKDSGANVYASADGEIVYAGTLSGWQGQVVVIKHTLETGALAWTRYAHIAISGLMVGSYVKQGAVIGTIADYLPIGAANDHLHFDVAHDDLGSRPGDWPGMDKARILAQYADPVVWLKDRRA